MRSIICRSQLVITELTNYHILTEIKDMSVHLTHQVGIHLGIQQHQGLLAILHPHHTLP